MSDAPQPPDPLEIMLVEEFAAAQLAQRHVSEGVNKIMEAWRRDRAQIIVLNARVTELETQVADLGAHIQALTGPSDITEPLPAPPYQESKMMLMNGADAADQ